MRKMAGNGGEHMNASVVEQITLGHRHPCMLCRSEWDAGQAQKDAGTDGRKAQRDPAERKSTRETGQALREAAILALKCRFARGAPSLTSGRPGAAPAQS